MDTEIKYTISFIITQKHDILICKNLTRHVQDLYAENYKMPMKGITEDLNKWRNIPCS